MFRIAVIQSGENNKKKNLPVSEAQTSSGGIFIVVILKTTMETGGIYCRVSFTHNSSLAVQRRPAKGNKSVPVIFFVILWFCFF